MSVLDLSCSQSFSFSPPCPLPCKNSERALLGCGYQLFLYFEIPSCVSPCSIKKARLVLFKLPDSGTRYYQDTSPNPFFAYPLLDFYSPYGCLYAPPSIDGGREVIFYDDASRCCTEADVTDLATAWADGSIENKGLILTAGEGSKLITYASDRHEIWGMRPMLRLVCGNNPECQPLSMRECEVALQF